MTGADRNALEAAHEVLRALIQGGDPQRYHESNEVFHGTIYAGTHNEYLAELTLATRLRVAPFRLLKTATWKGWRNRTWSMTAWSKRSCAATRCAPPRRCARTS